MLNTIESRAHSTEKDANGSSDECLRLGEFDFKILLRSIEMRKIDFPEI